MAGGDWKRGWGINCELIKREMDIQPSSRWKVLQWETKAGAVCAAVLSIGRE